MARSILIVIAAATTWSPARAELQNVFVLTRHGSRAPNPSVSSICPAVAGTTKDIEREFGAKPGQLTPGGQNHMRDDGAFLYNYYFGGADPRLQLPIGESHKERAKHFHFQATTVQRHIDSARLMSEEMFPGSSPPDVVIDDAPDNFLACPPAACKAANQKDAVAWMKAVGGSVYSTNKPCIQEVEKICGHNFTAADMDMTASNPHPPFQDVIDLFKFRAQSGLSLPKGVDSVLDQGRQIQYQGIQQRLFGTDEQVVYWMGETPDRILEAFASKKKQIGVYVTSREKLYAAEQYFGFLFNAGGIIPSGAIYPGTALIFELHKLKDGKEVVKVGYYYPGGRPTGDPPHEAALKWLTLPGCGKDHCDLDTFAAIIHRRSKVNGKDFMQICAEKAANSVALAGDDTAANSGMWLLGGIACSVLLFSLFARVFKQTKRPANYEYLVGA